MEARVDDVRADEKGKRIEGKMVKNSDAKEDSKVEKVCRICHFGKEFELITLGCNCKGELGSSHPYCAQAWFTQKGDRICEICGETAKNVRASGEEISVFMMEWNEMRMVITTLDDSNESSRRCKRLLCNIILAALLLIFLLLWFFHGFKIV